MPYIPKARRIAALSQQLTAGELNYAITQVVRKFVGTTPTYQEYNDAIGALECAKMELYRRRVALYEDSKCNKNGDVY